MTIKTFLNKYKIGKTYKAKISICNGYTIHLISLIDNCMVVYKHYSKIKKNWYYYIEHFTLVDSYIKNYKR